MFIIKILNQLTLKKKSYLGFGFILLAFLISISISVNNLSKLNSSAKFVYDRVFMSSSLIKDVLIKYEQLDKSIYLYLLKKEDPLLEDIKFFQNSILEDLNLIRDRILKTEMKPLIKRISESISELKDFQNLKFEDWEKNEIKLEAYDLLSEMSDEEAAHGYIIIDKNKEDYITIRNGFLIFSILIILIMLLTIIMFHKNIISPIHGLSTFCKNAKSNLSLRSKTPVEPELRVLSESLNQLLDAIHSSQKEASAQKAKVEQLVHVLCHDIKNPIGAVISYIELDEMGITPIETKKEKIKVFCNNAIQIIDDVRALLAVQTGKLTLKLKAVSLKEAVQESLNILENKFNDKKITIECVDLEDKIILADKTSLVNSVINNLLTNAIKFSFDGERITFTAINEGENIILKIRDFGMGMPKNLIEKVFDENEPTTRKGTSGESGTGFGMPLVQKFMNGYEGTIEIESLEKEESPKDHGTTMILKFWKYEDKFQDKSEDK